ncbi:uncharacterized protein LOC111014325 [Momordica charantia]|uniref:Uncharacterized protein LOC111014325 n=1 Tax=Momordica charantia TaxID=3673 RepID=A0A6J1CU69_MOMCH|nr:uncharacterized protein LOC111014325 [Momordica charantia]
MDSSAPAAASGYLLRQSSSSSHHFLHLFSSPPPSSYPPPSDAAASDEFNESEVFWTGDFALSNNRQFRSRISRDDGGSSSGNSGVLAALTDDFDGDRKQRVGIGTVLTRGNSISAAISPSSSRSIPRPLQNVREYSQSVPSSRKFQQSAPINVPAMRKQRNGDIVAEEEEMLPPHEIVARGSGVSPKTTFSVLEGVGRTLKGRDLRRVRNAVWHKTGFLD